MLEQQIAEIDCETHTFLLKLRLDVLVHRELCSKTHRVIVKNSKCRRAEENLVCLRVEDGNALFMKPARALANQFSEQSPVPFVRRSTPLRRTVSVDEAVIEYVWTLASVMLEEFRECTAKP